MSVLIKEMKLPRTDKLGAKILQAYIMIGANGHSAIVVEDESGLYSTEYLMEELPPHGGLIDAQKLYEDVNESVLLTKGFKDTFNMFFDEQNIIVEGEDDRK